jgi:hypothetical protein
LAPDNYNEPKNNKMNIQIQNITTAFLTGACAMKKTIFLVTGLCILFSISAQDIGRGFKALEKSDYAKAKEIFDKNYITKKENPAVCFGLMVIYADKNSPFYNITAAWEMAKVTEKNMNTLADDEKNAVAQYFANTEVRKSSWPVNKKMLQAIGAIEASLIRYIREENNLDLVNEIILKFPDYKYHQNVVHIRNQLEFRKCEKQNSLDGYVEFIQKYPDAAQVEKATKYRDRLALEKARSINTVDAFDTYLKNYPKSAEYSTAVKLRNAVAFQQAKQKNSIEAFEVFIMKYPDALEIGDAKKIQKQLLYEYAKRIQTLEAYDEFIKKYPEGTHYIDIFNLKSNDLGKKTLKNNSFGIDRIDWARSFDNKKFSETAGGIVVTATNQYIVAGNTIQSDSLFNDAWIIKLDNDGKMLWNKIIGGDYHDSIFQIRLNSNEEIFVLGYTFVSSDSLSKEAWIFKLDNEGKKIWNRSLGNWNINSFEITSTNDIFIGGYEADEALQNHYKIMAINNNGKKLWARVYTSTGEINNMRIDEDDNIYIAGSRWCYKISPKGYLLWENQFAKTDSVTCLARLQDGSCIFAGQREGGKHVFSKIAKNGSVAWIKEADNSNGIMLCSMKQLPDGKLMANGKSENGDVILFYSADGALLKSVSIPFGCTLHDFVTDKQDKLLLQFTADDNIFIVKSSGFVY